MTVLEERLLLALTAQCADGFDDAGFYVHAADHTVAGVGYEQVSGGVDRDRCRSVEKGLDRGSAVSEVVTALFANGAGSGDGFDYTGGGFHTSNPVIELVGDVEVAVVVESNTHRRPQLSEGGGSSVALKACLVGASIGGDNACFEIESAYAVASPIEDEQVVVAIDSNRSRADQACFQRWPAVSCGPAFTVSGDCCD